MKKRKLVVIAVLAAALCLSSCGTSTIDSATQSAGSYSGENAENGYYDSYASEEAEAKSADEEYSGDAAAAGDAGDPGSGDSALRAQDGQKIVYTGRLQMQTLEYDKSAANIRAKIREAGGFSESESEHDNNYNWYNNGNPGNTRYLSITARIPSEKFEAFMDSLSGDGKVMSRSVSAENISQVYANKESYKKALEKEQERLLIMMDKAETIDEMILVESRLSEVERQLNLYKTDLAAMDKDVEFSTVYIELEEVKRYTEEVVQTPFAEEAKYALEDEVNSFRNFCKGNILFVVRHFPYLIILAAVIVLLLRASARDRARRIAMMSDPEYAKRVNAKMRERAQAQARKREEKDAKRRGLFGWKKAQPMAGKPQPENAGAAQQAVSGSEQTGPAASGSEKAGQTADSTEKAGPAASGSEQTGPAKSDSEQTDPAKGGKT